MKDKKILVTLKFFKGDLNPFDGAALECAIESGAKDITVLAMAPKTVESSLKQLTRLGVKAVLVSDSAYAGSDTLATSKILARAIETISPDLIFCGRQSIDGDTAQVPPMLAKRLGFSFVSKVIKINGRNVLTRKGVEIELKKNTVVTFERIKELRFPSIFSKVGNVEIWDNSVLNLKDGEYGQKGSPTRVINAYESSVGRRFCKFIDMKELKHIIEFSLKSADENNIRYEAHNTEKLDEVYYFGNVVEVAKNIANTAIEFDYKNKTAEEIANKLMSESASVVLFSDDDELKKLAAEISVLTNSGLCADCIAFRVENSKFVMTRPAQGGNLTADIVCDSKMKLATARTKSKDCKDLILSVGKGAVGDLDLIKDLAVKLDAEICCSRTVADGGYLPYSSQVGLTGRIVSPKVYLALGISGAVQHTCAIAGADTVIAVNIDKDSKIFDYADYGVVGEVKDVKL